MIYLLDANVLIARFTPDHIHHRSAVAWLRENPQFAVCPITEGALVRFIFRSEFGGSPTALEAVTALRKYTGYEFWPADLSYSFTNLERVTGYRQVTDAYLVALAEAHGGALATFDRALVELHTGATLVPFQS